MLAGSCALLLMNYICLWWCANCSWIGSAPKVWLGSSVARAGLTSGRPGAAGVQSASPAGLCTPVAPSCVFVYGGLSLTHHVEYDSSANRFWLRNQLGVHHIATAWSSAAALQASIALELQLLPNICSVGSRLVIKCQQSPTWQGRW